MLQKWSVCQLSSFGNADYSWQDALLHLSNECYTYQWKLNVDQLNKNTSPIVTNDKRKKRCKKEHDDWLKKFMQYEEEGPRPRERLKSTWQRLWKRTAKHVNWTRRMLWIVVDEGSDNGCLMIKMGEWVNFSSGTGAIRYTQTKDR